MLGELGAQGFVHDVVFRALPALPQHVFAASAHYGSGHWRFRQSDRLLLLGAAEFLCLKIESRQPLLPPRSRLRALHGEYE